MQEVKLIIGGTTKRSRFTPVEAIVAWEALPEASRDFVIRYGLKQYLADGIAGAETQEQVQGGVDERLEKLAKADFTRTRGESTPTDSVETLAKRLLRDAIKVAAKAKGVKKIEKEQLDAAVEKHWAAEATQAKYRGQAEEQIKAQTEAALGVDLSDILADLTGAV